MPSSDLPSALFAALDGALAYAQANPLPAFLFIISLWRLWAAFRPAAGVAAGASRIDVRALLGPTLETLPLPPAVAAGGGVSTAAALADCDYVLLYTSASFSAPCRDFAPVLAAWTRAHAERLRVTPVLVSLDRSEEAARSP